MVAFVGVFLWGVDTAFFFVPARTLLQRYAPAAFHGRVLSINQSLEPAAGIVATPIVAVALGVVSIQTLGIVAGAIATVGGVVLLLLARGLAAPRRPTSTPPPDRPATPSPSAVPPPADRRSAPHAWIAAAAPNRGRLRAWSAGDDGGGHGRRERDRARHRARAGAPRRRRRARRHPRRASGRDRRRDRPRWDGAACRCAATSPATPTSTRWRDRDRRVRRVDLLMNNAGDRGARAVRTGCRWTTGSGSSTSTCSASCAACDAFVPAMVERGHGYVVNTASIAGIWAYTWDSAPYITSKFAAYGYSEALARRCTPLGRRRVGAVPRAGAHQPRRARPLLGRARRARGLVDPLPARDGRRRGRRRRGRPDGVRRGRGRALHHLHQRQRRRALQVVAHRHRRLPGGRQRRRAGPAPDL